MSKEGHIKLKRWCDPGDKRVLMLTSDEWLWTWWSVLEYVEIEIWQSGQME